MARPHKPLDLTTGRRFVIRDGMTADDIADGLATAFGNGRAETRKTIRQRLRESPSFKKLECLPNSAPPQYSKPTIHRWVCAEYPETRDHLSFDASQNVTIQLAGSCVAAAAGTIGALTMPDSNEDRAALIEAQARELAELREYKTKSEEAKSRSEKMRVHGKKGGRGKQFTE